MAETFFSPDDRYVYTYKTLFENDDSWCEEYDIFANFEDAFASFSENVNLKPRFAEFTKTGLGSYEPKIYCRMTPDRRITGIYRDYWTDDEAELFCYFNDYTFRFPTPFKEGDILTPVCGKYTRLPPVGGRLVLCRGHAEPDRKEELYGYFADRDYHVYREIVDDYVINLMDYEYAPTELEDEDRLLLPISDYLKGAIDLANLLSAHGILICEHSLNISKTRVIT